MKSGLCKSPRRKRYFGFVLFFAVVMAGSCFANLIPVLRDHLQSYLSIGDDQFGLISSVSFLASCGASLLAGGFFLRRYGAVCQIRWSLRLSALGMLVLALPAPYWLLTLAGIFLCGGATGALGMAGMLYLSRLFPRDGRRVISLYLALVSGTLIVLPLFAEGMIWAAATFPGVSFSLVFHLPFLLVAAGTAGASFAFRSRRMSKPVVHHIERTQVLAQATARIAELEPELLGWPARVWASLPPPELLFLAVLCSLHVAFDSSLSVWMPRFLSSSCFSQPLAAPGIVMSAFAVLYLLARVLLGLLPASRGQNVVLVLPGLVGGSVLLFGLCSGNVHLAAAAYITGGFLWSAEFPALMSTMLKHEKKHLGTAQATFAVGGAGLTFLLTYMVGLGAGRLGAQWLMTGMKLLAGGFIFVGLLGAVYVFLWGRARVVFARRKVAA